VWKKAIWSLRPAGSTPACGSKVGVFDAAVYGTAEAVPLRGCFLFHGDPGLLAIQSLRLGLHSGLRQSRRRLRRQLILARRPEAKASGYQPCPSGSCAEGEGLRLGGRLAGWGTGRNASWSLRLRLHSGVTTRASKKRSLGARFFGRVEPPIAQDAARWMGYPACQMALAKGRRMRPSQKVSRGAGRG
jgi:hypothetical protein